MKKILFIFLLLIAINFSSPNTNTLSQNLKHRIELNQEKNRELDRDELLKNKIRIEFRRIVLERKIGRINYKTNLIFNTS